MTRITLVHDMVLECRLGTIYRAIRHQNYEKAMDVLRNTLLTLLQAEEIELPSNAQYAVIQRLSNALSKLAYNQPMLAHNEIRDLHYQLMAPYIYQKLL